MIIGNKNALQSIVWNYEVNEYKLLGIVTWIFVKHLLNA